MENNTQQQLVDEEQVVPSRYIYIGIIILLALGLLSIAVVLWLAVTYPAQIEALRDVFLIALALESCVFGIVLMLVLVMVIRLVNTVEYEIRPVLEQTNETIGTVQGTTKFVSKNVVNPVVRTTSVIAGVRQGVKALFGDPKKNLPD
jgi:membrane protein implicated in regulation of membrane protease activity